MQKNREGAIKCTLSSLAALILIISPNLQRSGWSADYYKTQYTLSQQSINSCLISEQPHTEPATAMTEGVSARR